MTVSELVAQSRELVPHRAVLDSAEHVLVIARGKPFGREQAFHEVLSVAIRNRIEVLTLARALIDVSESRDYRAIPTDTAHTVAVLEWGELLEIPTEHHEKSRPSHPRTSMNRVNPTIRSNPSIWSRPTWADGSSSSPSRSRSAG